MSMLLEEKEPDSGDEHESLSAQLHEAIQKAVNDWQDGLGVQYVVDWVVACEVSTGDGSVLRHVSQSSPWRIFGLFDGVREQIEAQMAMAAYAAMTGTDDEDG